MKLCPTSVCQSANVGCPANRDVPLQSWKAGAVGCTVFHPVSVVVKLDALAAPTDSSNLSWAD